MALAPPQYVEGEFLVDLIGVTRFPPAELLILENSYMLGEEVEKRLDQLAAVLKGDQALRKKGELFREVEYNLYSICVDLYDWEHEGGRGDPCYSIERDSRTQQLSRINAAIVPLERDTNDDLDDFVKFSTLYSDLSIFVLPITIQTTDISYSEQFNSERDTWPDMETLIEYNKRYRDLIRARKGIFLPQEEKRTFITMSDFSISKYVAPFNQRPDKYVFTPLNSKKHVFTGTSYQEFLQYKEIVLPYFRTDIDSLIKIAQNETESFRKFNHYLSQRLIDISKTGSVEELQSILSDIDYEIANVEIESKKLSKLKVLQGVEVGFLAVSLSIFALADVGLAKQIAGITGSVNLLELVREMVSHQREKIDIKKSDFYLPHLLKKAGKE